MDTAASNTYENSLKTADALQRYFSKYHFENGGYHLKWFKIKVGPVYIPFPNTKGRIAAVKIHDIHHLLTEYPATLKGEAEIGAWEIASGCGSYVAAWVLNFGSFFYGMFVFPRPLLRAFLRGRACQTNLYHDTVYDQNLLNKSVGELRAYVGLDKTTSYPPRYYLVFSLYGLMLLAVAGLFVFLFCALITKLGKG